MDTVLPAILCVLVLRLARAPDVTDVPSWCRWPYWPHAAWWWSAGRARRTIVGSWFVVLFIGSQAPAVSAAGEPLGVLSAIAAYAALLAATVSASSAARPAKVATPTTQRRGEWRLVSSPDRRPSADGVGEADVVDLGGRLYLVPGEPKEGSVLACLDGPAASRIAERVREANENAMEESRLRVELCERTLAAENHARDLGRRLERAEASTRELQAALERARANWIARHEEELERLEPEDILRKKEELLGELEHLEAVLRRKGHALAA